jgi:hypothetical protein
MMILIDGDLKFEWPEKHGGRAPTSRGATRDSSAEADFTQCKATGGPELRFFRDERFMIP